jgi:hypothetical protein
VSVAVYVMPISTWLSGRFRTVWGPDGAAGPQAPTRSPEEVHRILKRFRESLDPLVVPRAEWDEEGPARSATIFSLEGFARPVELAQRWSYRLKLPRLGALEPPQIWLPAEFDPVFRIAAPWKPESEMTVASSAAVRDDLVRLQQAILKEERPELDETEKVTQRLRESAELGLRHRAPVIVEI